MSTYFRLACVLVATISFCGFSRADERRADELREHAEILTNKAEQAERIGQKEEARELAEKAQQLIRQAEQVQNQRAPESHDELRELQANLVEMRKEVVELMKANKREEANDVRHEADRLESEIARIRGPQQLEQLREQIGNLMREGRREDAEKVEALANRIRRQMEFAGRDREHGEEHRESGRGPEHGDAPHAEQVERRIHHLHVAADNLHAAGFPDQAQELLKHARRLDQEAHEHHRPEPRGRELIDAVKQLHQRVDRLEKVVGDLIRQRQEAERH